MQDVLKPWNFGQLNLATSGAPVGTTAPTTPFFFNQMPTGNLLIGDLLLTFSGNMSLTTGAAGTIVTDGEKLFITGIRIYSDMHMDLCSNVDGLSLFRINLFQYGSNIAATAISAATTGSPTYRFAVRYPFALQFGTRYYSRRPLDTILDVMKARLKIQVTVGNSTAFISGGTYSAGNENVQVCNMDIQGMIHDSPDEPADPTMALFPGYMKCIDVVNWPVSATQKAQAIPIPTGDGLITRILVSQRNTSTLAEVVDVMASTDTLELKILSESVTGKQLWAQIQDRNAGDYNITPPASWVCLPFDAEGSVNKFLDGRQIPNGNMFLYADVTTHANEGLIIFIEKLKPIPLKAERDYTIALRAKASAAAGR